MPARPPSLSSDLGLALFLRTVVPASPHHLGLTVVPVQTRGILGNSKLHEVTVTDPPVADRLSCPHLPLGLKLTAVFWGVLQSVWISILWVSRVPSHRLPAPLEQAELCWVMFVVALSDKEDLF